MARNAPPSAAAWSRPRSRKGDGMLKPEPPGSSCSAIHIGSCAKAAGASEAPPPASRGPRSCAAAAPCRRATSAASAASVGCSNTWRSGSSTPKLSRTRATSRPASSEWPPRRKKSSRAPTRSTSSRPDQRPARRRSTSVAGGSKAASRLPHRGSGRALRSTLPLGVRGKAASATTVEGTMYPGRRWPRKASRSSVSKLSKAGAPSPPAPGSLGTA